MYDLIQKLTSIVPPSIRALLRRYISFTSYDLYIKAKDDPYANDPPRFDFPGSLYTLGIIKEFTHYHKANIAACREIGVSYRVLDISGTNWIRVVQESNCDAYLVWPSAILTIWKEMFDDRFRIMEEELDMLIYPTCRETWLLGNKRRVRDWLEANNIPHPQTWVFYNEEEALEFLLKTNLPIVFKNNIGAAASGVRILRKRSEALHQVKVAFRKGVVGTGCDPRDRQWGVVYLQEYLPDVKEWRLERIGDSYFGYRKERRGDFHSGSHAWSWLELPRVLLDLLREVTERGNFTSMDVDIFETKDGRLLVNELHTIFGAGAGDMLRINGKSGRYRYDKINREWVFEEGDFSRNICANARVDYLVNHLLPSRKKKQ